MNVNYFHEDDEEPAAAPKATEPKATNIGGSAKDKYRPGTLPVVKGRAAVDKMGGVGMVPNELVCCCELWSALALRWSPELGSGIG